MNQFVSVNNATKIVAITAAYQHARRASINVSDVKKVMTDSFDETEEPLNRNAMAYGAISAALDGIIGAKQAGNVLFVTANEDPCIKFRTYLKLKKQGMEVDDIVDVVTSNYTMSESASQTLAAMLQSLDSAFGVKGLNIGFMPARELTHWAISSDGIELHAGDVLEFENGVAADGDVVASRNTIHGTYTVEAYTARQAQRDENGEVVRDEDGRAVMENVTKFSIPRTVREGSDLDKRLKIARRAFEFAQSMLPHVEDIDEVEELEEAAGI